MKRLADFDIWINPQFNLPAAGEVAAYPVQLFHSPAGTAFGQLKLELGDADFQTQLLQVRSIEPNLEQRKLFGSHLFNALFTNSVRDRWNTSLGIVQANNEYEGLRLRLTINVPELALLPWELLHSHELGFLATSSNQVVMRYLPVPEPPRLQSQPPLRLLLVVESPKGLPPIKKQEVDRIEKAINTLQDVVQLIMLRNASVDAIKTALLQHDIHILHFLGHGTQNTLALTKEDGKTPDFIDDQQFAQLFLGQNSLRLVVLTACQSSHGEGDGLFTGIGPALIQKRVPAVIAMQYPAVQLETAGKFSTGFYKALANGVPVDEAVNEARQLLSAGALLHGRDWSTPVLYMGTRESKILNFALEEEGETHFSSLQAIAQQSADAQAALQELTTRMAEIKLRAQRLEEWLLLERNFRILQTTFDGFNSQVKSANHAQNNVSDEKIQFIEFLWTHCRQQMTELKGAIAQIVHLQNTLESQNGKPALDINQRLGNLFELSDKIQANVFSVKIQELLPQCLLFLDALSQQLTDTRNLLASELKELTNITHQINARLDR